jgi:hypothetical protein
MNISEVVETKNYSYDPKTFTISIPTLENNILISHKSTEIIVEPRTNDPWMVAYIPTFFTIEIRPPYKPTTFGKIKLYSSCKGSTLHTFTEPGTHRIKIKLAGKHIYGSPLSVVVHPPADQNIAVSRWSLGAVTLDQGSSNLIEGLFQKEFTRTPFYLSFPPTDYKWYLDFRMGKALRKNWIGYNVEEPLVRNTWFWTDDQNKLVPYSPIHSQALEAGFTNGNDRVFVNDMARNKVRFVTKEDEGVYTQYRQKLDAKVEGRRVYRGYYGQSLDLNPVPLLWQFKKAILKAFLPQFPTELIRMILNFSKQSELDQYALLVRDLLVMH